MKLRNCLLALCLLLLFSANSTFAQGGIKGEIRDHDGQLISYASIFIEELRRGTTGNAMGTFSLPLPPGTYTVHFRSLGYTEVTRELEVQNEYLQLDIKLPPQTYMIPELRISATGEDPAYWIMRKAIGMAYFHLNEIRNYDARIYMKGTTILDKYPKAIARRVMVEDERLKLEVGRAYMLESLNQVHFTAPDKYKVEVMASQNTIPEIAESFDPLSYINASLYQEEIEGVVSPFSRNAFSHYRFSFETSFLEGSNVILKIKVTPRRKSQQLVEGFLYIVEERWCLYSADLRLNTIAGEVHLEQLYANVMMDAWMPVSHQIGVKVDIVGVKARVTYVSSLDYQSVVLNPNLPRDYALAQATSTGNAKEAELGTGTAEDGAGEETATEKTRSQEKINELLQQDELNNREVMKLSRLMEKETRQASGEEKTMELDQTRTTFVVSDSAEINDSLYWNSVRPIPLSTEEHSTLVVRDSIIALEQTGRGGDTDSTGRRSGTSLAGKLLMGHRYQNQDKTFYISHGGLIDPWQFSYNTVDGISYGQELKMRWEIDSSHVLSSELEAGYAFHRKAPQLSGNLVLWYAPMARGKLAFEGHYRSADFNRFSGIPGITNLDYTLFLRDNYLKMFEQLDLNLFNRIDIYNGWVLSTAIGYGEQRELVNNADFSFFYRQSKDFTPNIPGALAETDPTLDLHRFLRAEVSLRVTPWQHYIVRNGRKSMRSSRWPTFRVNYRQAIPVESDWSDYAYLGGAIYQELDLGTLSSFRWNISGGYFLWARSLHFSDFMHFQTNALLLDVAELDRSLVFLDYYESSTADYWVRGDVEFTTPYLMLKYLPWLSERLWTESLRATWMHNPSAPNYIQLGYSLNEVFFLCDLGVFVGFQEWSYKNVGFRMRINF